jgi:hypothetical protein
VAARISRDADDLLGGKPTSALTAILNGLLSWIFLLFAESFF